MVFINSVHPSVLFSHEVPPERTIVSLMEGMLRFDSDSEANSIVRLRAGRKIWHYVGLYVDVE